MNATTMMWMIGLAVLLPTLTAALGPTPPTYFISAPNVIRVGVDETIVINIFGDFGNVNFPASGVPVTVELQSYPFGSVIYNTTEVNVKKNDPETVTLRISPEDVVAPGNPSVLQYVYLRASCEFAPIAFDKSTKVLLSYRAGFTFIQTDKPIYTPKQTVFIRLVTLDQQMRPSTDEVRIDILTPQGVIVERFDRTPESGFATAEFKFPALTTFGNWTVVAYYGHQMKHNTSVQFFVKEYVLPTFSVNIKIDEDPNDPGVGTKYILSSFKKVTIVLSGRYVFGEDVPVQGHYRIKYSLMDSNGSLQVIKNGTNGPLNSNNQATHFLYKADILEGRDFDDLLGKRLHIEAFIIESATGVIESSNNTVLQFVDSPYKFKWDKTKKYFKTNLPFQVEADVLYCYGDPVPGLDVRVNATGYMRNGPPINLQGHGNEVLIKGTSDQGIVQYSLNLQGDLERIEIEMTTVAGGDLANFEQTDTFEVLAFTAASGSNKLLIQPNLDDGELSIDLERTDENEETVDVIFTYIVAGGKILQAQYIDEVITSTVADFEITPEMVPSARIVAYYVNGNHEVVADSVWIDVDDVCENQVVVELDPPKRDGLTYYDPGEVVTLTLKGKPQTKVALLAVDSAVYLLQDYHRLNQKKVFARMASYDLGCGPGGGQDTQDIFKNAGVTIITNAGLSTQARQDLSCEEHNRRRRSVPGGENYNLQDLLNAYQGNDTLMLYCNKGQIPIEGRSCSSRANRIARKNSWPLDHPNVQALKKCCLAGSQAEGRSGGFAPLPPVDFDPTSKDIHIRSMFPESWLYNERLVDLGDSDSADYDVTLPDSITTWVLQAVGVSPLHGMCVADNQNIQVRRELFMNVALPYSVMQNEQVAIQVTVYNYESVERMVYLRMVGVDELCSNARPGEYELQVGTVAKDKAKSFTFIVVPLKVKDYDITIYMTSRFGDDAVRKTLHVVHAGIYKVQALSILLDPSGIIQKNRTTGTTQVEQPNLKYENIQSDQADLLQGDKVQITMPDDAVPDTEECEISVVGSLLGPVASAVVEGLDPSRYIKLPTGCGEQTLSSFAPNVYIYKYLKGIDKVTPHVEENGTKYTKEGIQHVIQYYRTPEGAYILHNYDRSAGRDAYVLTEQATEGVPGLTAMALRIFCTADELNIDIPDKTNVICKPMSWLSSIQNPNGSFTVVEKSYLLPGVDEPISLTALILIALSECSCPDMGYDKTNTINDATTYLEGVLNTIGQDAHTLAIVTYALAMVDSQRANEANTLLKALAVDNPAQGTRHFGSWSDGLTHYQFLTGSNALTVQTTAYALLAQVKLGDNSYSYPIVQWLVQSRNQFGYWWSTQDTIVALQALAEYAQEVHTDEIDLTCDITATDNEAFERHWDIQQDNALVKQATHRDDPVKVPTTGYLKFKTNGVGVATLSVDLHYYKYSGNENLCPFDVTIKPPIDLPSDPTRPETSENEKPKKKIKIEVCAKYTGEGNTNMAIIDVGLLSGFKAVKESLKKVTENPLVPFFEETDRNVIFYADYIPKGDDVQSLCVAFDAYQEFEVSNVQPAPVKVYDYYMPDRECVQFYRPDKNSPLLEKICDGGACVCAAGNCANVTKSWPNITIPFEPSSADLKKLSCESVNHFAYMANFTSRKDKDAFQVFVMTVTPLKIGVDQGILKGQQREFLKSPNCDQPVFEANNEYLIIGKGGLPITDDSDIIYRYVFGGDYTVIHWPNETQRHALEKTCKLACPAVDPNNLCKVGCRKYYRRDLRLYLAAIEEEFVNSGRGCPT